MNEYVLFLDESKAIGSLRYFCLAGYIISSEVYCNDLMPRVDALKGRIFGKTDVVLHEKEIRDITGDFRCLSDRGIRESFWDGIHDLLLKCEISVVGVGVSVDIATKIYKSKYINSDYNIALQILLENYVHFLERHNAQGNVVIESTNATADSRLRNLFYNIVSDGTLFLDRNAFQTYLKAISFHVKQDNHNGLQIADFIPNAINRKISGLKPKQFSTIPVIESKLYDGNLGMSGKFGLKIIE